MVSFDQNPRYLAWAESRLGVKFDPRTVTWLTSLDQSATILGVVVFSYFNAGSCSITVVSSTPRFLSKGFLLKCLMYVFGQLNLRRVNAFIAVDNQKSLSLAQQLGFRIEGRARQWFPTGDAFLLGLLREECKFLEGLNGISGRSPGT